MYALPYLAVFIGLYGFQNAWLSILLYHAGILLGLAHPTNRQPLNQVVTGWNRKLLFLIVTPCLLTFPRDLYIFWPFMEFEPKILPELLASCGLDGWRWPVFMIYLSTIHPVLEELHWRGVLCQTESRISPQDFLFGGYHIFVLILFVKWPYAFIAFGVLTLVGWIWRLIAMKTKGLGIPILSHAVADAGVVLAIHLLIQ